MIDFSRNHFELFGLPERFRFDAERLDEAYRKLQGDVHPDRFAAGSDQEKRIALQSSARVNEAYRALRDPVLRAQYLLELHGIEVMAETDTRLPLDFLERQLERREEADAAVDARDSRALAAISDAVRADAAEIETMLAQALDEEHAYDAALMPVRELKFLSKLEDDLDAMQGELDD